MMDFVGKTVYRKNDVMYLRGDFSFFLADSAGIPPEIQAEWCEGLSNGIRPDGTACDPLDLRMPEGYPGPR